MKKKKQHSIKSKKADVYIPEYETINVTEDYITTERWMIQDWSDKAN